MKIRLLLLCFFCSQALFAQFFVNSGAVVGIGAGAIVTVKNMDFENLGDLSHAGDLEVGGNITNSQIWVCDPAQLSHISLTSDWFNNASFNPGIGKVSFNGTNQNMGGTAQTHFHKLALLGSGSTSKTLLNTVWCADSFYLNDAELATNGNTFSLRNGGIPIQKSAGYISTFKRGIVQMVYPAPYGGNSVIPLGMGPAASQYKPFYLINPAQDSFNMILFDHSPTLDGLNAATLQDSLCNINENYFYQLQTFGSPVYFGVTQSLSEQQYSKLVNWNGSQWDKLSNSGPSPVIAGDNLALNAWVANRTQYISMGMEKPFVSLGPDFSLVRGASLMLNPVGYFPKGANFLWDPASDLSCSYCQNPVFTMGTPGTLTLKVSNGPNCEASGSVTIISKGDYNNNIPNAFTPNSDLLNEGFGPVLLPGDKLVNLEIYDRWGGKIYEGAERWDGSFMGQPVMPGVYFYQMSIQSSLSTSKFGTHFYISGNVTVLR